MQEAEHLPMREGTREALVSARTKVLDCLLNRGRGSEAETLWFRDRSHDELVNGLAAYLTDHRHHLGFPQIEVTQALNDRGVDLLVECRPGLFGFQVKSHRDALEADFSANVKRQFAESLSYGLDCYYVLFCVPLIREGKRDLPQAVRYLINEMSLWMGVAFELFGPEHMAPVLRDRPVVLRDELFIQGALSGDALHPYEQGYEHLPKVTNEAIERAKARLNELTDTLGFDLLEEPEGRAAFLALEKAVEREQARRFQAVAASFPESIREQRKRLIASIAATLAACRQQRSWDDRSEYKLPSWLEHVPEEMIPFTSLPNLVRIDENVRGYLAVHVGMQ